MPFVLSSPVASQDSNNQANPSYLFVFEGRNATLKPEGKSRNKFTLTLPLRKADHLVTWFSDRPVRDAGHIDINEFVQLWQTNADGSFKADPPNVAMSFGQKTLIAKMTNPKIVQAANGKTVLKADMDLVDDKGLAKLKESKNLGGHVSRVIQNRHAGSNQISYVGVFVDSCPATPGFPSILCGLQLPIN